MYKKGQTVLMLLVISLILITFVTTMVAMVFTLGRDTTSLGKGEVALSIAESGAQNAVLRLLRDPNYAGESNLAIGDGIVTTTVTGTTTKTLITTSTYMESKRKVTAVLSIVNGVWQMVSWTQE